MKKKILFGIVTLTIATLLTFNGLSVKNGDKLDVSLESLTSLPQAEAECLFDWNKGWTVFYWSIYEWTCYKSGNSIACCW